MGKELWRCRGPDTSANLPLAFAYVARLLQDWDGSPLASSFPSPPPSPSFPSPPLNAPAVHHSSLLPGARSRCRRGAMTDDWALAVPLLLLSLAAVLAFLAKLLVKLFYKWGLLLEY